MSSSPVRIVVAMAAMAAAVAGVAAPAAAQNQVAQPFAADSGDNCRYGSTTGTLTWAEVHPPEFPSVAVSGTVADRPLPADPGPACPDDGHFTIANFAAYNGNVLVDSEAQQINNGRGAFDFRLAPSPGQLVPRIERVVVVVCREPVIGPGTGYCGQSQTYFPPNVTG